MDIIRKIDMFGMQFGFEENKSIKYTTWQGSLLTSIVLIISSVTGFLYGQEIYLRKESNSRFSKVFKDKSSINITNFPLVFTTTKLSGSVISNPLDYFDVKVNMYYIEEFSSITLKPYSVKKCDPKSLNVIFQNSVCNSGDGCLCLDFNEPVELSNKYASPNSKFLDIKFIPCNPKKSKCPEDMDKILTQFYINVGIQNSFVDPNNYDQPISYYFDNIALLQSKDFHNKAKISLTNNTFISDNGWLLETKIEQAYTQILEYKTEAMKYNQGVSPIASILFDSPNLVDNISRSYMKIQDLFAKIGGVINALFLFMKLISFHYMRFLYLINLVKLSKDEKSNKLRQININHDSNIKIKELSSTNVKLNNYIPQKKDEPLSKYENKMPQKLVVQKINQKIERVKSFNSNIESTSYLIYLSYLLKCKVNLLDIKKKMTIVERKIDISMKIKIINFFYENHDEKFKLKS